MTQRFVSLKSLEMAILGAVAFVTSGALVRFVSSNDADLVTTGDVRFEIILALCYAAVLLIFLFHLVPGFRATFYTPATPALLILACSSALWAELPGLVLRRAAGLAGATLFGVVLASRLTFAEQLLLLRRVLRVIAFLSLAAWVLGLLFGVHLVTGSSTAAEGIWSSDAGGPWRGIFNHKNVLGSAVALALLAEWHIPAGAVAARASKAVWMCAYAALLALSNSITSAVTLVLTIVVMYAIKSFRGRYGLVLPAGLVAMLFAGIFVAMNAESVMGAMGRSSDLSGRVDLWHWIGVMIFKKPFLGYGFSGFWRGASDNSTTVETHIGWSPMYSHNGYLEILLSLGFIGLLLFAWMAVTGLRRALILARSAEDIQDLWPLAFLVFFLIHNMGECSILWQNSLEWALCVATVAGADPRLRLMLAPAADEMLSAPDVSPEYA